MSDITEEHAGGGEARGEVVSVQSDSTAIQKAPQQANSALDGIIDYLPEEPVNDPPKGWTRYVPSIGLSLVAVALIVHGELNRPPEPPAPLYTAEAESSQTPKQQYDKALEVYEEAKGLYDAGVEKIPDDKEKLQEAWVLMGAAWDHIQHPSLQPKSGDVRLLADRILLLKNRIYKNL